MTAIRIGCVKFLNTLPLIEGLDAWTGAELEPAVPSHLIDMLLADRIDVGLVSLIDAARSPIDLALLPVGMIGCDGPTMTVGLFSRVPIDRIRRIHADTDSHTSVALARVILHERYGLDPEIVDFDARERVAADGSAPGTDNGWPETVLLIGDKVVADPPPQQSFGHRLDLGQAWHEMTGLPFVYAVWMCRAEAAESERVQAATRVLDRQRRRNATRLDWLVGARAAERHWPQDQARTYIGSSLKYDVGERERAAVDAFLRRCARLDLAPDRPIRWARV